MAAARFFGALVFIALLGIAVSPVLLGGDAERDRPAPSPVTSPSPTEQPDEDEPSDNGDPGPRMSGRYPKACLRPVARPGSFGLVAAYSKGTVTITDTNGEVQATIRAPRVVRPPLAWSPSGQTLAIGPQGLFWRPDGSIIQIGDVQHGLVQGRRGEWGWSPLSDCGVQIDEKGALFVTAANPLSVAGAGRPLIDADVESFSYSPDGLKLGLVLKTDGERSIWIADLVRNRLELLKAFPRATCCISLAGWSPSGRDPLFWAGTGASVMADGWPLTSVAKNGDLEEWGTTLPSARPERCDERLLGLTGGDRSGDGARLAQLAPGRDAVLLSDEADRVRSFSCSPDGRFIVAQTDSRLTLFDAQGARIRDLTDIDTPNGQWSERSPEWGPARTGILFVRSMHLQTQLWFLSEGQVTERPIAVLEITGRWADRSLVDWSATPPSGLPAG